MQLRRTAGAESGTSTEERAAAVAARRAERAERAGRTERDAAARAEGRTARSDDIDVVASEEPREGRAAGLRERITGRRATTHDPSVRDRLAEAGAAERGRGGRAVVTEDDIRVMTGGQDLGIYRARRRYGGFDLGAVVGGLLAAVGMTALLAGLAGAIGTVGYQLDVQRDRETLSVSGFVAGLAVLVLSFLVGGWVAGRAARYDGGKNGLASALFFVVLSAVLAGLGAWFGEEYDVLTNIRLPQWFTSDTTTAAAVLSAVVALVVMLAAGWFGGVIGSRYHRKADAYLAEYAQGGRPVTAGTLLDDRR